MNTAVATNPTAPAKTAKHLNSTKAKAEAKNALDGEILGSFDFNQIEDKAKRDKAKALAGRIETNLQSARKAILEIGKALIELKHEVGHGTFERLALMKFGWSKSTTENYMAIAKGFGDDYCHVDYLPAQIVYPLAKTNALVKVRQKVIAAAKDGRPMTDDQVKEAMAKAKPKKLALAASNTPANVPDDKQSDDLQEAGIQDQRIGDAVSMLVEALGDDFPRCVDLIASINSFMEFKDALHHARTEAPKVAA